MSYIEISNIKKQFGDNLVLKGDSLAIEKGEIVAIVGDSGNGKTTFLRCLCGLYCPDEGTIKIDGEVIFPTPKGYDYYQNVGLVFQNYNLFNQYSALDNIKLALDLEAKRKSKTLNLKARKSFLKEEKQKNEQVALSLLEKVGMLERKDYYPYQLSGGQSQRVAIARALAKSPKILCFDEPTSALDPKTRNRIEQVILNLKKEGQTILLVSHDFEFVKAIADKVYFMSEGNFVEGGSKEEFFFRPKTEALKDFLSSSSKKEDNEDE